MSIRDQINQLMDRIAAERDIRILYACESGSRAWGFASADSDYDIRFIYVSSLRDYLRLRPPKDAFDVPIVDDLDAAGWDIRKTAELMHRSNAPLMEWIGSPVVYRDVDGFHQELRDLRDHYFDPKKTLYHYLSMTQQVWNNYLHGEAHPVRKKYLYALRPLACIRYIALHGKQPPTAFAEVRSAIDWSPQTQQRIDQLIRDKEAGTELGAAPADEALNALITEGIAQAEVTAHEAEPRSLSIDKLDDFILRHVTNM